MRRLMRVVFYLSLLGGLAVWASRLYARRPLPPIERAAAPGSASPWVAPVDGACPTTHPVKAKLASKIFHVPGGASYERTVPDRCYVDAAAAEADGLRAAKR